MTQTDHWSLFTGAIEQFERDLVQGTAGVEQTTQTLDKVVKSTVAGSWNQRGIPAPIREQWYTRLAAALTQFVASYVQPITLNELSSLTKRKPSIVAIFAASGYRSTSHLIALSGEKESDGKFRIAKPKAALLLAFLGIDDVTHDLIELSTQQQPNVFLMLMSGWLNQRSILTNRGEENRTILISKAGLAEKCKIGDKDLPWLMNTWMYCSYASYDQKHVVKISLNKLFVDLMQRGGINPTPVARRVVERPTMLVVHERFIEMHAMFRCFAPLLRPLRKHFQLVALAEKKWIDDAAEKIFDQVLVLENNKLAHILDKVQSVEPDMIFYPSLGMSHWSVLLANLRIAPIQVIAMGHPATSHSEHIDYAELFEFDGDPEAVYSEFALMDEEPVVFEPHTGLPDVLPAQAEPTEREVRIAINSKVMKLSSRLLTVCKRLTAKAQCRLTFVFFPGEMQLLFDGLSASIKNQVPNSEVAPYLEYADFLNWLATCDFAISAFPFGNTNGTVDTCLLGMPNLVYKGREKASQTDALVLKKAGLPDWLVCQNEDEMVEKAMKLIEDVPFRTSLVPEDDRSEIRKRLFEESNDETGEKFAQMMHFVYRHHEDLQARERRQLSFSEVAELSESKQAS